MAEKITIYAGEPLASVLAGFDDNGNRSARINAVADAYRVFVADNVPEFTEGEWMALIDVVNGSWVGDIANLRLTWASMADAGEDGIGEKWGIDPEAFSQTLRRMSDSAWLATREVVARFWNAQDGSTPPADLLRQCGAHVLTPEDDDA